MKIKIILILIAISLFTSFALLIKDTLLSQVIISLSEIDEKLGKELVKRIRLEAYHKQTFSGGNEKYILKDQNDALWLFKTYPEHLGVEKDIKFSKFAQITGINTPLCYELILPINDEFVYGSLQKVIPDLKEIALNLSLAQAGELINIHIFRWLCGGDEVEVNFYNGQFFLFDVGEVFDNDYLPNDIASIFRDIFKPYLENRVISEESYLSAFNFINFIQKKKDSYYRRMFKKLFFFYSDQEAFFLRKKNNLKSDYKKFYENFFSKKLTNPPKEIPLSFYIDIINKIRKSINEKRGLIAKTALSDKPQSVIRIITSKKCRDIADTGLTVEKITSESDTLIRDIDIRDILRQFSYLAKTGRSIHERLAAHIYIAQFKSGIPGFVPALGRFTFHPNELDEVCLEANLRVSGIEDRALEKNKKNNAVEEFPEALNSVADRDMFSPVVRLEGSRDLLSCLLLGRIYETGQKFFRFYPGFQADKALSVYNAALEKNGNSVSAWVNLFQLYLLKEDISKAVQILEKIIIIFPEIMKLWNIDLDVLDKIGDFPKEDAIRRLRKMTLSKEDYYTMGLFYVIKNNLIAAKEYLSLAKKNGCDEDLTEYLDGFI